MRPSRSSDGVAWAWPDAGWTVQIVAGLAAAATVATLTSPLPLVTTAWILLLVAAGVIGGALGRWAVEGSSSARVVLRAVAGGALLAFVLAAIMLPPLLFLSSDGAREMDDLPDAWISIGALSGFVGAPVGAAIALLYTPLLIVAAAARRTPSHASGEHVGRFGASWLLAAASAHAVLVSAMNHGEPQSVAQAVVRVFAWLAPLLCGVALVPLGYASRRVRQRWLERVRAGKVAGYRVAPVPEDLDPTKEGLMPVEHGAEPSSCTEMLVRVADEEHEAGYRELATPSEETPVALVARP